MDRLIAPAWETTTWFNTPAPLTLERLQGRVVFLCAFQMLCPGCVSHGIPQAQRVADRFKSAALTVVGLHTVFEHHDAMGPDTLRVFLHEYRVRFPVGVDAPGPTGDPMPRTMRTYEMRGTPTTLLFDTKGRLRSRLFGVHDDLLLGSEIGSLLAEAGAPSLSFVEASARQPEAPRTRQRSGGVKTTTTVKE